MSVNGSASLTFNAASCQGKGSRVTIYTSDEFDPSLVGDRFIWTTDWPAIALMSQVCRHGGKFNIYTKDGRHWEAWVWPQ